MTPANASDAVVIVRDPRRLRALCALWQTAEREIVVTLQGRSMTPTIRPGSRLTLRCGRGIPDVGEIIAFHRGASLVVHRLIAISEPDEAGRRQFICQGDSNPVPDAPIGEEDIVGVVVKIDPPPIWEIARQRVTNAARRGRHVLRRVLTLRVPAAN